MMELFFPFMRLLNRLFQGKDPVEALVAPLLYYIESRLKVQRIGQGELRLRLLHTAVHIVRFHKFEETLELKTLVKEIVNILLEALVIFCLDTRAVAAFLLGSKGHGVPITPYGIPIPDPP